MGNWLGELFPWNQYKGYLIEAASAANEWEKSTYRTLADRVAEGSIYGGYTRAPGAPFLEDELGATTTGAAATAGAIGVGLITNPVVAGSLEGGDVPSDETQEAWAAADLVADAWPVGYLENVTAPPPPDDDPFEIIYSTSVPTVIDIIGTMPDPIPTVAVDIPGTLDFGSFDDSFGAFSDLDLGGFSDQAVYGDYFDSYVAGDGGGGGVALGTDTYMLNYEEYW